MKQLQYAVIVSPLPVEDGGGFVATVPDLPGCLSDGDTPEEALENVRDAISEWLDMAARMGRAAPKPSRPQALA
jgi:antitoxin HicB